MQIPPITIAGKQFPVDREVRVRVIASGQVVNVLPRVAAAMVTGGTALLATDDVLQAHRLDTEVVIRGKRFPLGRFLRVRVKATGQVTEMHPRIAADMVNGGLAELALEPSPASDPLPAQPAPESQTVGRKQENFLARARKRLLGH